MVINNYNKSNGNRVRFISYTGRFPNLCSGILTLEMARSISSYMIIQNIVVGLGVSQMKTQTIQTLKNSGLLEVA